MTLEKNLDLLRNDLSERGKSAGGLLVISSQECEIRKKGKGLATNALDRIVVLVSRAPEEWTIDLKNLQAAL